MTSGSRDRGRVSGACDTFAMVTGGNDAHVMVVWDVGGAS